MQRTRQVHFSQQQFPEELESYSSTLTVSQIKGSRPPQAGAGIGATALISAGILILAIWSVTLISNRDFKRAPVIETRAALSQPVAHSDDMDLPAPGTAVRSGSLGIYHWSANCPLENARSLRHNSGQLSIQVRAHLTRRQAQLQGYRPCNYCEEIGYWDRINPDQKQDLSH